MANDIKRDLLEANGAIIRHGGKRWKIEARETHSRYLGYAVFSCTAQDLDPANEEEARFCILDLWQSESSRAVRLLAKAVKVGRATVVDTGREGIGSSRGVKRRYNPAVGTWLPV